MKILHYSLGLPPYRSGGMTKYTNDLILEQSKNHKVFLLFPGYFNLFSKKTNIKFYENYSGINVYEIVNPLMVPLLNGITDIGEYTKKCDRNIFIDFLKDLEIEIVNIHTFMGLYIEFLEACAILGIRIIYTAHDYFGLCPKVNFIYNEKVICKNRNNIKCSECNKTAYSKKKIIILQSKTYRWLKNRMVIEKLKKISSVFSSSKFNTENGCNRIIDYETLFSYYEKMFKLVDKFIFNSTVTKKIYDRYILSNSVILPLTHKSIIYKDLHKNYKTSETLKLTYLGPRKNYKGFELLINIMGILNKKNKNIKLNIYGCYKNKTDNFPENIIVNGTYKYNDLEKIFLDTDILIVPSICYETFGFVTLEALSFGIPVITTDRVGSKDLITNINGNRGIVCKESEILNTIEKIIDNRAILKELKENIKVNKIELTMEIHCKEIEKIYKEFHIKKIN